MTLKLKFDEIILSRVNGASLCLLYSLIGSDKFVSARGRSKCLIHSVSNRVVS
jgi:hypothetical protein